VLGSGTVLDTARLKYLLGERLGVDSRSVHAFIIGEHGDSELAVWSGANVSGIPLDHFCELRGYYEHDKADEWLQREVRDSAYEIIRRKGATYYGVAMAVERIVRAIVRDEHSVLPVSNLLQGQYGIDGLCMSIPAVVGRNGVEDTLEIPLSPAEREALRGAVAALPERERQVILLRYFRGMTQDRTAKVLGVSQVQVSRIERKAVEHLRRKLE